LEDAHLSPPPSLKTKGTMPGEGHSHKNLSSTKCALRHLLGTELGLIICSYFSTMWEAIG